MVDTTLGFLDAYNFIMSIARGEWSEKGSFLPILPSGIVVLGIDSWVERFIKIFQNIKPEHEALSSVPINFRTQSSPPNAISFQKTGGDL
jgi:hypothetical protein